MNEQNYELLYNKNKLFLQYNNGGTIINQKFCVVKGGYTCGRSEFKEGITVEMMIKFMYDPEERRKWDRNIKLIEKLENLDDDAYIIRCWMNSPMFMIDERDIIDKRVEIYNEGIYYNISTSVREDVLF
jgi:Trp operon repressor